MKKLVLKTQTRGYEWYVGQSTINVSIYIYIYVEREREREREREVVVVVKSQFKYLMGIFY